MCSSLQACKDLNDTSCEKERWFHFLKHSFTLRWNTSIRQERFSRRSSPCSATIIGSSISYNVNPLAFCIVVVTFFFIRTSWRTHVYHPSIARVRTSTQKEICHKVTSNSTLRMQGSDAPMKTKVTAETFKAQLRPGEEPAVTSEGGKRSAFRQCALKRFRVSLG